MKPTKKTWRMKYTSDKDRKNLTREWKVLKKELIKMGMSPILKYKRDGFLQFTINEIPYLLIGVYIGSQTYFANWDAFIDKFKPTRSPYVWSGFVEFKHGINQLYQMRDNLWPEIARSSSYSDVTVCKHDYFENANFRRNNYLSNKDCDKLYNLILYFNSELEDEHMILCMYVGRGLYFKCYKRIIIGVRDIDVDEDQFNLYCDLLEEKMRNKIIEVMGPDSIGDELEIIINGYNYVKEKFNTKKLYKRFDYGL